MQTARPGQTRIIGKRQQVSRLRHTLFGVFHREKLQKAFGTDTRPAAEQLRHVKFAEPQVSRQHRQARLLSMMRTKKGNRLRDTLIIRVLRGQFFCLKELSHLIWYLRMGLLGYLL